MAVGARKRFSWGHLGFTQMVKFTTAIIIIFIVFNVYQVPCAQIFDFPAIDILVRKDVSTVEFGFYYRGELSKTNQKIAAKIYVFSVFLPSDQHIVWRIQTSSIASMVSKIEYGVIPTGFKQTVPSQGEPPPLEAGRKYSVWAKGDVDSLGVASFVP